MNILDKAQMKVQETKAKGRAFANQSLGLSIGDIGPIALTLGVAVIIISVVSLVLGNMQDQVNDTSTAYDIIGKGLDAMSVFGDWFNIIVIVAVAAIILGLVMLFRGSANRGGGV